jgi:hypothetical protein
LASSFDSTSFHSFLLVLSESTELPSVDAFSSGGLVACSSWGHSVDHLNLEFSKRCEVFADTDMLFNNILRVSINNSVSVQNLVDFLLMMKFFSFLSSIGSSPIKSTFVEFDISDNWDLIGSNDCGKGNKGELHKYLLVFIIISKN